MSGFLGYFYSDLNNKHNELQSNYDSLMYAHNILQSNYTDLHNEYTTLNETHQSLLLNYTTLNEQHQALVIEYDQLDSSYHILSLNYTTLEEDYEDLYEEYSVLNTKYLSLFNDYNILLEAFNEPLPYEGIPTTTELRSWLALDETDEIWYDYPNFICGDFAVMLSQHAKLEHWDMGVVAVSGYDENYESYAHAFNAIICTEGLVYVEPQNDHVWWYSDYKEIYEEAWFEIDDEWIFVEDYTTIVWYD